MVSIIPVIGEITSAIISEAWLRYFVLVAAFSADSAIGSLSGGTYPITDFLSWVIASVFQIQGFVFPVYYGVSSLLIIIAGFPILSYLIKTTIS